MTRRSRLLPEEIKRYADHQINWNSVIPPLRPGRFVVESDRSIHGDAPKCFIRIKEYEPGKPNAKAKHWPAYIAKVGSKRYPVESITEHLLTRIGQALGVKIADSKLLVMAGQVRFLSKYFLAERESLVHGLEIFRRHLDDEMVDQIAADKREHEFYTFDTVVAAIEEIYPADAKNLLGGIVEMLAFDAIVGNNDRHPLNWGVIVPSASSRPLRFAPVFDSAPGMFWNLDDSQLGKFVDNAVSMTAYVNKSHPQIGLNSRPNANHFELVRAIYNDYPTLRPNLDKFSSAPLMDECAKIVHTEFGKLMSDLRRRAICICLSDRHQRYRDSLFQEGGLA